MFCKQQARGFSSRCIKRFLRNEKGIKRRSGIVSNEQLDHAARVVVSEVVVGVQYKS
jgi:hypothetical protein